MIIKEVLQARLVNYSEKFSDLKDICALYLVDIEHVKYVKKVYKHEKDEEQFTKLLQKGFVLFTESTIQQAVLESTEYNMVLRRIDENICFVLIAEKSLSFGKIIALIKQRIFDGGK